MKYYYDIIQNTPEWDEIRRGKITASSCSDLLMDAKYKGNQNLIKRIAYERYTGQLAYSGFNGNYYTQRGHELEPIAREAYELETFNKVNLVGFVGNDTSGCSPDGLIDNNGLIEIKCLEWSAHIDLLNSQKVPTDYLNQIQFQLFITECEYCIFYAFHPGLKRISITVEPDVLIQQKIAVQLIDIETKISKLIQTF